MKLLIKRLMAGLLLTALVVSGVPSATMFAAETTPADESVGESEAVLSDDTVEDGSDDSGDVQTESQQNNEEITDNISQDTDSVSEKINETDKSTEKAQESTDSDTADENISVSADGEESNVGQTSTGDINFVYVESPYLETPGTQRIVFYFNKEIKDAKEITLTVADSVGNEEEWQLAESKSNLYLFEKEYTEDSYADTYHAVSLNFQNEGGEEHLDLEEMGIEAKFGVDQEYSGIEELEPLDAAEAENSSAPEVEASIVTIGDDGVSEAQDDIADALETAAKDKASNSISLFSRAAVQTRDSDDIVVALDPGHDNNDRGAQANGLKEEVLTLKIANYCKDELEKYAGVSVFMTRTTADCPYDCSNSGECIQARVDSAKEAGADIFVSFHLNAVEAESVKGAEIIIPNNNWKPSLGTTGEKLAEEILDELVKIGLTKRSIYSKNSISGTKYDDGSTADYFAVPRMCKEAGIAGIIVEHAFLTNSSDVSKFLKTESGLKKLGVADATGIAQYLDLSKDTWTKPKLKTPSATYEGTKISWNSVKGATGYAVYRKSGNAGWKMVDTTMDTSYIDETRLTNGTTYYYTVRAYKGSEADALNHKYSGNYWTSYDSNGVQAVYMTTPTIGSTTTAASGIKLSWQKISGVSGYAVYRKTSGSGWGMIGTTTSTSYTDNGGLKSGETYYYTLRAYKGNVNTAKSNKYNAKYWSGYDNTGVAGKYYSTPDLTSAKASASGTTVSWKKVSGATGYAVYRKVSGGSWATIATTTSLSYTDKAALSGGKTYYYTVRAYVESLDTAQSHKYDSNYWSHYDTTGLKSVYLDAPDLTGTTTAKSGIKVTWKKVNGAAGYAVYRKTASKGWGMIDTTTSTNYTDKDGIKSGAEYSYTVRAYVGSATTAKNNRYDAQYWSGYNDSGIKGKYCITPDLISAKASASGTTVSWKKVSGATGYAVYRKVSGGSWATIATTTSLSYTDKAALSGGKTYYYTVRAYVGSLDTAQSHKYDSNYWSHYDTTGLKSVYLDAPDLTGTTTAKSGIKVTWKKVNGAAGYAVYRKTASKGWGMIDTTTSTSYTDKDGIKSGAEYSYTVRAYVGSAATAKNNRYDAQYWSGYDDSGVKGKYYAIPVLTGEKASASGRTVTWKAVSDVSGYAIYRKVSGGDWAMIDTTTSTSYTDGDKLADEKTYYYTVRAYAGSVDTAKDNRYDSSYWSYYDTTGIKTVYTGTPELDTAVKLDSGIKVTWKAVSGASGYAVYRKSPEGSWGMIDTTTSTSYTDKTRGVKAYYYTVRAYRGNVTTAKANKYSSLYWSGYDNAGVTVSDLDTPVLKDTKVVNTGIQISWNPVKGASGYAVYRKTATTGWGMIGTSTSAVYVDTEAGSSGTVYYYTVRAYEGNSDTAISNKYDSKYWSYFDTKGITGSAYEIEGKSDVTVAQMVKYYNTYSSIQYPADKLKKGGAATIEELAQIFYEEATDEGIKPEVVWCQTMHETGYLKFGGDVKIDQYNFAGLGSVEEGDPGLSFSSVREGVRAQVQHMKAYASATITADTLKNDLADPRFEYVKKGTAKYVEILGIQENPSGAGWATSIGYGKNIVLLIQKLQQLG